MALPQKLGEHTRSSFVKPAVLEVPLTTAIINAIMPYFPKSCLVIAGYLSDDDQFWKVNYHWEYLLDKIDKSLTKGMSEKHQKCAKAIRKVLMTNPPNPQSGYTASSKVGSPQDQSSREKITQRWATVKQSKKDFKAVIDAAGLLDKNPPSRKAWHLAVAPVAKPGTSKHGSGFAVDISGNNATIKSISLALGATMAFDEKSHVHVEFKTGVKTPEYKAPVAKPQVNSPASGPQSVLSVRESAELQQCRPEDFQDEVGSYFLLRNDIIGRSARGQDPWWAGWTR